MFTVTRVAPPRDLTVMFSSPPSQTYDHQPLPVICENIQRLGVRTKRETEQYLKEYAAAQTRNRGLYAVQGERERKTWDVEEPQTYQRREKSENYRVAGIESPLLKARLHLGKKGREETPWVDIGDRASINIEKEMTGLDEDGKESRQHTDIVTSRKNGTRRKQVEDDDDHVREENERGMSQYSILNDTHSSLSVFTQLLWQDSLNAEHAGERRRRLSAPLRRRRW